MSKHQDNKQHVLLGNPNTRLLEGWLKRDPCHSHICICIFSVATKSTVMLFDRPLSFMAGINMRQRLEWTKGLWETQKDGSQELDGHEPSIEMEEKMSTHSQQYLAKDFNKMKPIIIIIDCLVQFAPLGSIHTWAYRLKYTWKTWVLSSCSHCNHMLSHVPNSWRGIFSVRYIFCLINAPSCFLALAVFFLLFFLDMGELSLTREGYTSFLGVSQELKVRVGDDVVLNCSASSSDKLSFSWNKNVRKPQECAQQHLYYTWGKLVIGCLTPSFTPSLCLISIHLCVGFSFSFGRAQSSFQFSLLF